MGLLPLTTHPRPEWAGRCLLRRSVDALAQFMADRPLPGELGHLVIDGEPETCPAQPAGSEQSAVAEDLAIMAFFYAIHP